MRLVLDLIYFIALVVASPWLVYSMLRSGAWRSVPARFGIGIKAAPRGVIWLHGSSVGEISVLAPLVEALERQFPDIRLLITSFTATGLAAARTRYRSHFVLPFPVDFSFVTGRLLRLFEPRAIVIVESDIWPNFLRAAIRQAIPVAVLNGRMSMRSFRLHRRTGVLSPWLRALAFVGAQTPEHAARFAGLGVPQARIAVTGNMKYDLTPAPDDGLRDSVRKRLGLSRDNTVAIAASLHLPEDELVFDSWQSLSVRFPAARLIVVPRYPDDGRAMAAHAVARGFDAVLLSRADMNSRFSSSAARVLIADTLGELRELYHAADIAFVGGSLHFRGANKGGHNLMEPAILGLPVLFGPHNFSFKETVAALLGAEAGIMVADGAELAAGIGQFLESDELRRAYGTRARKVVLDAQGATARSMALISPLLGVAPVAGHGATDDNASVRN